MIRDVLRWVAARVPGCEAGERGAGGADADDRAETGGGADTGEEAEAGGGAKTGDETGDSRLRPSVLDASVRYAHGMDDGALERELAAIEEQAQERRDRRNDR